MRCRAIASVGLAFAAWLAASVTAGARADDWEDLGLHRAPPGIRAPAFTLSDVDGRSLSLAELRGRPVLLNFWASWCASCEMEMPGMKRLQDQVAGLVVVAINFRERAGRVKAFTRKRGIAFRFLLDSDGAVASRYQVKTLPFTVLVDPRGEVLAVAEGPRDWGSAAVRALVERLARGSY